MKTLLSKIKWANTLTAFAGIAVGSILTASLMWDRGPDMPLVAGNLVEHKLLGWDGIVLWNQEGPAVAIRWIDGSGGGGVWQDTVEAEWVRK